MGDAVKIAVKSGLIISITIAIIALFANVQIPQLDFSRFQVALGFGKAVIDYYAGWMSPLLICALFLLSFNYVALPAFHVAMIAIRWIMKVNE